MERRKFLVFVAVLWLSPRPAAAEGVLEFKRRTLTTLPAGWRLAQLRSA